MDNYLTEKNIQALNKCQSNINRSYLQVSCLEHNSLVVDKADNESIIFYSKEQDRNLYFHSRQNPQKEALSFLSYYFSHDCHFFILIGLGFGYLAEALLKKMYNGQQLLIIEPDSEIFTLAIQNVDLSSVFMDERVSFQLYLNEASFHDFMEAYLTRFNASLGENHIATLIPPPYLQHCEVRITKIAAISNLCIRHMYALQNTITFFADIWLENFLKNAAYITESIDVELLFGQYPNIPAYLIAAGPSLDRNIAELKKVKKNGLIFAGYTALRILQKHEIQPDFIVAVDGRQLDYEDYEQQQQAFDIPLIYSPLVDYRLLEKHSGIKIRATLDYDTYSKSLYQKSGRPFQSLYAAGTVTATMLDIAFLLGCSPIVFVGQDLAFYNEQAYASGSNYGNLKGSKLGQEVSIKDMYGNDTTTTYTFLQYKKGLEDYIISKGTYNRFLDATEGGIYIKNTVLCCLSQVVEQYKDKLVKPPFLLKEMPNNEFSGKPVPNKINTDIQHILEKLPDVETAILETLNKLRLLEEEKRNGMAEAAYRNSVFHTIEECNHTIDQWNEDTGLFYFSILSRLYKTNEEASIWKKHCKNTTEEKRLRAVHFYNSLLTYIQKIETKFLS